MRFWAAATVVMSIALAWHAPHEPGARSLALYDNDSLYQLARVGRCLDDYPRVAAFDPLCHHPDGLELHWPPLLPFLYATAVCVLGGASSPDGAPLISWAPPLFGACAVLLFLLAGRSLGMPAWLLYLTGFLAATSGNAYRVFAFGRLDHHALASLCTVAVVYAWLRGRVGPWALGAFALLALTPEGPFYLTLLVLCGYAADVWSLCRGDDDRERIVRSRYLALPVAALAALFVSAWLEGRAWPEGTFDARRLGWFHVAWMLVLGVGCARCLDAARRYAQTDVRRRSMALVASIALGLLLVGLAAGAGTSEWLLPRFFGAGRLIVSEEQTPFLRGFAESAFYYQLLAFASPLLVWQMWRAWQDGSSGRLFASGVVLAAFLLAGLEFRHLNVLAPLVALGVGLLLADGTSWLRGRLRAHPPAVVRGAIALFVVPVAMVACVHAWHARAAGLPAQKAAGERALAVREALRVVGVPSTQAPGVLAPWYLGHHLSVLGGHPVPLDPFNFPESIEGRLEEFWLAPGELDLVRALEKYRSGTLVLVDPERDVAEARRAVVADADRLPLVPREYAATRLFMSCGLSQESGRLRPRSFSTQAVVKSWLDEGGSVTRQFRVPEIQIFDLVKGAVIRGKTRPSAAVRLEVKVRFDAIGEWPAVQTAAADASGVFELRVALAAPSKGVGFEVQGLYRLTAADGETHFAVPMDLVESGGTLDLTRQR